VISAKDHPAVTALRCAYVARAATIFRADRILIYLDDPSKSSMKAQDLFQKQLMYLAVPQYLRKQVFSRDTSLKYAGVMPPLRAPAHTVPQTISQCKTGDLRMGLVARTNGQLTVEAGLEREFVVRGNPHPRGRLVLMRILDIDKMTCEIIEKKNVRTYLNYDVLAPQNSICNLLNRRETGCLAIGTSRLGVSLAEVTRELTAKVKTSSSIVVVFGSPRDGLKQILSREGCEVNDVFDFFVNTVQHQGVATVRTEEAVMISLAVLDELLD
jgi:predicted SPOUT superfamily RNA methylase MTH1